MVRARKRVTIRKYEGNDLYSWAVFVDGRVKWTGLARSEARYYAQLEEDELRSRNQG